jgi:hypothetical protein
MHIGKYAWETVGVDTISKCWIQAEIIPKDMEKDFTDRRILSTDNEINILNNDMCNMLLSDNLGMSLENTSDNRWHYERRKKL